MKENYHTAVGVKNDIQNELEPIDRYEIRDSVAFRHNLTDGIPEEYRRCDVLYTETSWNAGQPTFNKRAGIESSWRDYMKALGETITELGIPSYVVTGRQGVAILPKPDSVSTVMLNGAKAQLVSYGENPNLRTEKSTIQWLAKRHKIVGDPSCGYGRTGSIFLIAGKNYVMSDYNGKCISYIASLHTELGRALW